MSIPGVRGASTTHLRHLDFAICVFIVLVHELLHLVTQVVILGVLPARRGDGTIYPTSPYQCTPPHTSLPEAPWSRSLVGAIPNADMGLNPRAGGNGRRKEQNQERPLPHPPPSSRFPAPGRSFPALCLRCSHFLGKEKMPLNPPPPSQRAGCSPGCSACPPPHGDTAPRRPWQQRNANECYANPNLRRAGAPLRVVAGAFVPIPVAGDFVPVPVFAAFSASDAVTGWFNSISPS